MQWARPTFHNVSHPGQKHRGYSASILTPWIRWVCRCVFGWYSVNRSPFLKRRSRPGRWACVWACDSFLPALQSCCLHNSIEALQTQQVWKHLGSVLEWIRTVSQTETMWPHNENTCRFGRLLSFWLASIDSENYNFFFLDLVSVFIGSRSLFCSKV